MTTSQRLSFGPHSVTSYAEAIESVKALISEEDAFWLTEYGFESDEAFLVLTNAEGGASYLVYKAHGSVTDSRDNSELAAWMWENPSRKIVTV